MLIQHFFILSILCMIEGRDLIQGNVIWRHGDRSSSHTYPNDPYKEVWKNGNMQLTETGMAREYNLGLYLRSKYGHMISEIYREWEIYVKSTDIDRTIMSAQCVGAGIYAPTNATKWNGGQTFWRPFPIHAESSPKDWLYNIYKYPEKGCTEFDNLKKKIEQSSQWYKESSIKYAKFFENITRFTGVTEPYNIRNTGELYDNLFCLRSNHYKLPTWADATVMNTLEYLAGVHQGLEHTDFEMKYTKTLSKMRSGIVLEKVLQNMQKRINNETKYSIVGYSAHDSSVVPLLVSMGAYNWIVPPYSSCVMLDLYLEDDSTFSVEFWYRNDTTQAPHRLSFYECGTVCSFGKFQKVAATVIPGNDSATLCGITDDVYCRGYLVVGLSVFSFVTVLLSVLYCMLRKHKYSRLPQDETEVIGFKSMQHS